MNYKSKKAISFIEVSFVIFVLLFTYIFVFRKIQSDIKYTDFKRLAGISMTHLDVAGRNIADHGNFVEKFNSEYDMIKQFAEQMDADKICYDAQKEGCWSNNWLWANTKMGFKTKNHEFVIMKLSSKYCNNKNNIPNTCGEIVIDTNGKGAPNKIGQDILKFYVLKSGIIPAGTKIDFINTPDQCDFNHDFSWSCTAKLLNVK